VGPPCTDATLYACMHVKSNLFYSKLLIPSIVSTNLLGMKRESSGASCLALHLSLTSLYRFSRSSVGSYNHATSPSCNNNLLILPSSELLGYSTTTASLRWRDTSSFLTIFLNTSYLYFWAIKKDEETRSFNTFYLYFLLSNKVSRNSFSHLTRDHLNEKPSLHFLIVPWSTVIPSMVHSSSKPSAL
jgi:hypothetical protein